MSDNLKGEVVVVIGAAGLLGQSFCQRISDRGGNVVIADKNMTDAESISKKIENSLPLPVDITSKESLEVLIKEVKQKYGKIDSVVNTAYPRNKNYGRKLFDVNYEDFCENTNLNIGGYFLSSQVFLQFFQKQGHGNIVNISSIYGVIAPRFEVYEGTSMTMPVEYSVIKSGLIHLTKYLAKFSKGMNVRINCISPGGLENSQPEAFLKKYAEHCLNKGMLDVSDISGALEFLLSKDSLFVNGQNIIVDDGFSL